MCAFGTKAKAECSSEAEYAKLVAATKQAKAMPTLRPTETEWMASQTSKCLIPKSMQKDLRAVSCHLECRLMCSLDFVVAAEVPSLVRVDRP